MERAVLDYMAKLWRLQEEPLDSSSDYDREYWGYLGSSGTTEGNIFSLYNARGYLAGRPLLYDNAIPINETFRSDLMDHNSSNGSNNAFTPVVFYSEEAHQSLNKAVEFLNLATLHDIGSGQIPCPLQFPDDYPPGYSKSLLDENDWPYYVPADTDDTMYVPSLVKLVNAFVSRGYPPIVVFTVGTSFKGGYGNPAAAIKELVPILKQHKLYERKVYFSKKDPSKFDIRNGFWFHIDGALGAGHLPFLEMAINKGLIDNVFPDSFPVFDFRVPEVTSIAVSIYKWFGSPLPSSVILARRKNIVKIQRTTTGCDGGATTFLGARSGLSVLAMWNTLAKLSLFEMAETAAKQERMVIYSLRKLREFEKSIGEDLWLSRSPGSLFICMKTPREDVVAKYSLFCLEKLPQKRNLCHICIMQHVNEKLIDEFIGDLKYIEESPLQNRGQYNAVVP